MDEAQEWRDMARFIYQTQRGEIQILRGRLEAAQEKIELLQKQNDELTELFGDGVEMHFVVDQKGVHDGNIKKGN